MSTYALLAKYNGVVMEFDVVPNSTVEDALEYAKVIHESTKMDVEVYDIGAVEPTYLFKGTP
tara:strand:- start:2155 stop:2340 length:186 start_codon:yes stop_codon:yes gene_type:complete